MRHPGNSEDAVLYGYRAAAKNSRINQDIRKINHSNKPKLIRAVQDSFDIINKLYDYAKIGVNVTERERKYKDEIERQKAIIEEKDKCIEELNIEIDKLYIDTASPLQRNKKKLKDNLIELTPDRIKALSMDVKDIKSEYEGLF